MTNTTLTSKIDFTPIRAEHKALYDAFLTEEQGRGCEFSFANLRLWGRQSMAQLHGHVALFSQFNRRSVYPFPLGKGDKKTILDAIIADAAERGIPCRITGISEKSKETLEELYPDRFRFHTDEGSYDYVYDINDLADLSGKKYHAKRNHIHRFEEAFPSAIAEPIGESNIDRVKQMLARWYETRLAENPDSDFQMEQVALEKAFREYDALGFVGLALTDGEEVLAFTLATRLSDDTFDVHFEKAKSDVQGAYAAINRAFARHIRATYPEVRYLNREEDMGLEGLRKAKQSYYPHHRVKKYWACLLEDGYEY